MSASDESDEVRGVYSAEEIAMLNRIVDGLDLSGAEKRMLAGHNRPDAGCILDGVGRLVILTTYPSALPMLLGSALARLAPGGVRRLVGLVVDQAAEGLIEELTAGLAFPDESEANR